MTTNPPTSPTVEKWERDLIKEITDWYREQHGACACLGDCKRCGHHICFGCGCFILDKIKERVSSSVQEAKAEERSRIKQVLFMYTHQWVGDDKERFCESCGEVIHKYSPCEATKTNINCLVEDLLASLKQEEAA